MLLKDLEDNQVCVGIRVWDYHKTKQGTIVKVDDDRDINHVTIIWDDGKESSWLAWDLELELV